MEWLKDPLDAPRDGEHGPVLAAASCDFKRPVHHPATLHIDVYAEPPGRTSLTTHYRARLVEGPSPVATGTAVLVWVLSCTWADARQGCPSASAVDEAAQRDSPRRPRPTEAGMRTRRAAVATASCTAA